MKTLAFDTISTTATKDEEGGKNKEHAYDCISESDMETSSKNRTNKNGHQLHFHII